MNMAEKELSYIVDYRGDLVAFLPMSDSTLVFVPNEKRWGVYSRTQYQINGDEIYRSTPYSEITPDRAKEIYSNCPLDEWLPREKESILDWENRITTETEKERKRNAKKIINKSELKIISEITEKCDNDSWVMKTTTVYECPCGKGKYIHWKEHTGWDDWGASLHCDECKNKYYST